jgi:hypothetical protein
MSTTRRKVRSLTDLNAKQTFQKVDGNDVIFEASGSLASGKVTINVPLTASAISSSGHLQVQSVYVKNNLEVSGNLTVRGTPTIISSDVLEVKDNIIVINKISGSDAVFSDVEAGLYVNRGNAQTASLLWISSSDDWQFQKTVGGTPQSADLVVNKLKPVLISGSAGVAVNSNLTIAATASLHTSASFSNISLTPSNVTVEGVTYNVINLDTALHAIDAALANAGLSAASVQSAYKALRFQYSGTLDANGEWSGSLPLTQESGKAAFPTSSFNYITTDVMIDDSGRWVNDLIAIDMEISSSAIWVTISAAAAANTGFRLIAVNENTASYSIT